MNVRLNKQPAFVTLIPALVAALQIVATHISVAQERKWEELTVLLDRGYRIVAAHNDLLYLQNGTSAFYCYDNGAENFTWLCWDIRKTSPKLMKQQLKSLGQEK